MHLQGLRQTRYGNNLDNPWIVLLEECCQLQKYFILLKDFHGCSVLCHSKYMCTSSSCRIVPLLHSPDAPVRVQTSERAYMTAIRSSPGLCHPGESGHTEVCYQWSKASPLILFHVKQKGLNTAPDLKLWQWNIPGEKRDKFVWKGALRLPECFCLFIRLLKLLQPVLYWGRDKETEDKKTAVSNSIISVSQVPSGLTCTEVEEGGPRLHLAYFPSCPSFYCCSCLHASFNKLRYFSVTTCIWTETLWVRVHVCVVCMSVCCMFI